MAAVVLAVVAVITLSPERASGASGCLITGALQPQRPRWLGGGGGSHHLRPGGGISLRATLVRLAQAAAIWLPGRTACDAGRGVGGRHRPRGRRRLCQAPGWAGRVGGRDHLAFLRTALRQAVPEALATVGEVYLGQRRIEHVADFERVLRKDAYIDWTLKEHLDRSWTVDHPSVSIEVVRGQSRLVLFSRVQKPYMLPLGLTRETAPRSRPLIRS